mgnify:CR=1 FL=1
MSWQRIFAIFVVVSCKAQSIGAREHIRELTDHWRWVQYWEGTTELGSMYRPGLQFQALLFWHTTPMPPSSGFCASEMGVCRFYPNIKFTPQSSEMKIQAKQELRSAFRSFASSRFGEKVSLPELPSAADFTTEVVRVTLPPLDVPDAIRDRRMPPQRETDALLESLSCEQVQQRCRLLIPYYSPSDPWVPVYSECASCAKSTGMIIFMRLVEGHWGHGPMDYVDRPEVVTRIRRQIENALMIDANR